MIKNILKNNTIWIGGAEIWFKISTFAVLMAIARIFGDVIFGQIAFVFAYLQLFQIVLDFGLHFILIREISQNLAQTNKTLAKFLGFKAILGLVIITGMIATTLLLQKPAITILYIVILGIFPIIVSTNELLRSVFRAHEKFKLDAITKITESTILLISVSFGLYTESVPFTLAGYSIASIAGLLIILFLYKKNNFQISFIFSKKTFLYIFKKSWPLALAGIFVIVYFRIDTIMLSFMTSDQETGWYNAAYNFIFTFIFIPSFIMMSFFPKLSQFAKKSITSLKKLYTQSLFLITGLAIILMGILFIIAPWAISRIYGTEFLPAVPVLRILTLAVFMSYVSHVWLFTLTALKKQIFYTWAVGFGMIINIALNYIFIPRFGIIAASWTTVITEVITGGVIFIACQYLLYKKEKSDLV